MTQTLRAKNPENNHKSYKLIHINNVNTSLVIKTWLELINTEHFRCVGVSLWFDSVGVCWNICHVWSFLLTAPLEVEEFRLVLIQNLWSLMRLMLDRLSGLCDTKLDLLVCRDHSWALNEAAAAFSQSYLTSSQTQINSQRELEIFRYTNSDIKYKLSQKHLCHVVCFKLALS